MSTWRTSLWRFWPWKRSQEDQQTVSKDDDSDLNRFDQYALLIEKVLVWENPVVSIVCVLSVNLFFWIVFSFERKFYSILTLLLWLILFYNSWNEHIFPYLKTRWSKFAGLGDWYNRKYSAHAISEYGRYYMQIRGSITSVYIWTVNFRKGHPGLFCIWMFVFFVCLAALGQAVPGLLMAYIASMIVLIGPGIVIHLLPSSFCQSMSAIHMFFIASSSGENDSEVDEYLPESNKDNLAVLSQATDASESSRDGGIDEELEALIPENGINHTNNGDSSSHVSYLDLDVTKMPSHDQESLEGSLDAPEEFELSPYPVDSGILELENKRRRGARRERKSWDKNSCEPGNDQGINFESMHFEGDSSEEEELRVFSEGMSLGSVPHEDQGGMGSEMAGRVSHLLGEFLVRSGAVATVVRGIGSVGALAPPAQRSSERVTHSHQHKKEEDSDEDFEMISEEDLS